MNFMKFLNIIDKKMSMISIDANFCTKVISPRSSCNSCIDVCPSDSVTIKHGKIEIDDECLKCGLCSTVCPTNALLIQKPSLTEFIEDIARKAKDHDKVYIQCKEKPGATNNSAFITVPCLGSIPKEGWLTLISKHDNLALYSPNDACKDCQFTHGQEIWQEELKQGEAYAGKKIERVSEIKNVKKANKSFDTDKRDLFSSLFREVKATNRIAVKELLGASDSLSTKEKINTSSEYVIKKQWGQFSQILAEKIINESALPYMNKQKLFLDELKSSQHLQEGHDISLPVVDDSCTLCGACAILCPTDALSKVTDEDDVFLMLEPYKCVDCKLCEEFCFEESLTMTEHANSELFKEAKVLITKTEEEIKIAKSQGRR